MIQHTNSQNNPSTKIHVSCNTQQLKTPTFNVSYHTQEQLDHIESFRHPLMEHHKTHRKSSAAALLRQIIWRHLNLPNQCITGQHTLGKKLKVYSYDKNISDRQIRRLLVILKNAGLITYLNPTGQFREIHKAQPTPLGMNVYHYVIQNNKTNYRLKLLHRTPRKPMNPTVLEEFTEINVRHTLDPDQKKNHIHIALIEPKPVRKIDLNAPSMSYEELQNGHLQVNDRPYPEKIDQESRDYYPQAENETPSTIKFGNFCDPHDTGAPEVHWTEKRQEFTRPAMIRENDTKLPYEVFQMLDKNFSGEQKDILCEILLSQQTCIAYKISMIECVRSRVNYINSTGKKIRSFGGVAKIAIENYLNLQKTTIKIWSNKNVREVEFL